MTKPKHASTADTREAVDGFMASLDHPLKGLVQAIREAILDADPAIAEGVKWNAPSYRTGEYFATTNFRDKAGIAIILHRGAKAREDTMQVADPHMLLIWLAHDRAKVVFTDLADINARRAAFQALIRAWIVHV